MKYFIGNWKMNTTVTEAVALAGRLEDGLQDQLPASQSEQWPEIIICPPFLSLSPVSDILDNRFLQLGAQDAHWADNGAHTGDISATMLKGIVQYVLIGHSERRKAGENEETIARKLAAVVRAGLTPILCVGEEDPNDIATDEAVDQLQDDLADIEPTKLNKLIVAYEPVWAVNGEIAADAQHIGEVVAHLKDGLDEIGVTTPTVIYGGAVTPDNATTFLDVPNLDGLLIGRASLDAQAFLSIVKTVTP